MRFRRTYSGIAALLLVVPLQVTSPADAQPGVAQAQVVSAVPSVTTPNIDGGQVQSIAQVGTWIVAGGTFTSATSPGGSTAVRNYGIVAFDQTAGTLNATFTPTLNGSVNVVIPGPIANTVYVGGAFTTVNGVASTGITLLNLSDGSIVSGFTPVLNGTVYSARLSGGRLFLAGAFTTVGGVTHDGLATINPTTGALDPFVNVQLTGHHNYNGTGATGAVGGRAMDISPNGTRAVVLGDFKDANGALHDQVVMLDLNGSTAAIDPNWNTNEFTAACASKAFDTYVSDVAFSPDGSYFVVADTGGSSSSLNTDGTRSLCDSASRWSTTDTGTAVKPTWVDYTGNDSFWSVAITGTAIYAGGHERWLNNPNGSNVAGAGATPRPGIVALDPASGLPLGWNPGRNPRGAGAFALLATAQGLYVGSDTDYIGNVRYERDEIAFFPLAGGYTPAATATTTLPANVYEAGPTNSTTTGVGVNDLAFRSYAPPAIGAQTDVPNTGITWSTTRGAFVVGSTLFYGSTDGNFYRASFGGTTVGTPVAVDPYDDPAWDNIQTGSGQTYQGVKSGYYAEMSNVTGAFYSDGRLYYTQSGKAGLYWRYFSPDSGIIGGTEFTATGGAFSKAAGMFASGTTVYYASSADGSLHSVSYSDGGTNGTSPTVTTSTDKIVSSPAMDGRDWRSRGMFLYNLPVAQATASCTRLTCSFSGYASTDAYGTVTSYAWNFGDGTQGTGVNPSHGYSAPGTYTYSLVVTDNRGASSTAFTGSVTTTASTSAITFAAAADSYASSTVSASVTTPAAVAPGDTEVLFVTTSNATSGMIGTPSGWTPVATQNSLPLQTAAFEHTATAADPGSVVTVPIATAGPVAVQLADYAGVGTSPVTAAGAADANTATHTAPAVSVATGGAWVLDFWADKSSTTTAWNLPAGVVSRDVVIGTASAHVTGALADSGAPVAAGTYPAQTASVTGGASGKGAMLSVVLSPQS